MLAIERKIQIVNLLKENKKVLVRELIGKLGVSDETIRKDLKELESNDIIIRSHGGAVLKNDSLLSSFMYRECANFEAKKEIASLSQDYIKDGMLVMVDSSTTAKLVVQKIGSRKEVKIITNSLQLINESSITTNLKFISTGGEVLTANKALVGRDGLNTIHRYKADLCILGVYALDLHKGFLEKSTAEADMKLAMAESSTHTLVVADHSKFKASGSICSVGFSDVDYLVTDREPSKQWQKLFADKKIECKFVNSHQL